MFRLKKQHKNDAIKMVKDTIQHGSENLSHVVEDGIKAAESQIVNMQEFIEKNPGLKEIRHRVTKHPIGASLALIGIGLIMFGSSRLLKK